MCHVEPEIDVYRRHDVEIPNKGTYLRYVSRPGQQWQTLLNGKEGSTLVQKTGHLLWC